MKYILLFLALGILFVPEYLLSQSVCYKLDRQRTEWLTDTTQSSYNDAHEKITDFAIAPNPFTGSTKVSFFVHKNTYLRLSLTDVFGYTIAVLFDGITEQGLHSTTLSSEKWNLSSGLYFISLSDAEAIRTKQVIVLF